MTQRTFDACRVLKPGILTTIQDLGRRGHYSEGIPDGGAWDAIALRLGNRLVGNPGDAAALEVLLGGLCLEFIDDCWIAITGADFGPTIDGERALMWQSLRMRSGQRLTFQSRGTGLRLYVCFEGGLNAEFFLSSRSTYLFLRRGGFHGRNLERGDVLQVFLGSDPVQRRSVPPVLRPSYGSPWRIRMVYGLQYEFFTEESIERFHTADWVVTPQADRMGIRLRGSGLRFKSSSGDPRHALGGNDPSNIPTEGNPLGSIQCPAGDELIVIGPDGPCEGGYAKLGAVIRADFPLLAQMKPGERVRFEPVSMDTAYSELDFQMAMLKADLEVV